MPPVRPATAGERRAPSLSTVRSPSAPPRQSPATAGAVPERAPAVVALTIPMRTVSLANMREHWSDRQRRARGQREAVYYRLLQLGRPELPVVVLLVRLGRELDDDNLRGALKSVRDGVAFWLGADDRDPRITWEYAQEKPRRSSFELAPGGRGAQLGQAVRIEIRPRA